MRGFRLGFFVLAVSSSLVYGQSDNPTGPGIADLVSKVGASAVRIWTKQNSIVVPESGLSIGRRSQLLEQTLDDYTTIQNSYYSISTKAKMGSLGATAAFGTYALYGAAAVGVAATAPVSLPVIAIVSTAATALSLDTTADYFERAARERSRDFLVAKKEEILAEIQMTSFAEMKSNLEVARQRMLQSDEILSDFKGRTIGNQDLRNFAVDMIIDSIRESDASQWDAIVVQDERLTAMEGAFNTFAGEMISNLATVNQRLTEHETIIEGVAQKVDLLQQSVQAVDAKVATLGRDQAFIADFVLDQMPPAQKAAALQGGFLAEKFSCQEGEASPCEGEVLKQDLIDRFEREADLQSTVATASKIVQGMNDTVTIANNLGIPLPEGTADVLAAGDAISGALSAYASGNPIGAVAALSGMFGSQTDADAERHAIMMAYLKQQFEVVNQKLDDIIENQKKIYEAILSLHEEMRTNFASMDRKLTELQRSIDNIADDIVQLTWNDWKSCNAVYAQALQRTEEGASGFVDPSTQRFLSFNAVLELAALTDHSFSDCRTLFNQQFTSLTAPQWFKNFIDADRFVHELQLADDAIAVDRTQTVRASLKDYIDNIFTPARMFSENARKTVGLSAESGLLLHTTSTSTIAGLNQLISTLQTTPFACFAGEARQRRLSQLICGGNTSSGLVADGLLKRPLLADAAIDISKWMMVVSQMADVFDAPNDRFYKSPMDMMARPPRVSLGRPLIRDALSMIDFVVASYDQMYGGLTAKGIIQALDAAQGSTTEANRVSLIENGKMAIALLSKNPYLAENVASMLLIRASNDAGTVDSLMHPPNEGVFRQSWLFAEESPQEKLFLLRGLFRGLDLAVDEAGVPFLKLTVGDASTSVRLPAPAQLADGRLVYPPAYFSLLMMRDQLVDRLFEYDMVNAVPEADREGFALTIVN